MKRQRVYESENRPSKRRYLKPKPNTKRLSNKSILGIETKYLDTILASTTLATTGTILSPSLNIIAQGDGQSDREGRRVVITKISIRGIAATTAAEDTDAYRFILYQDKQCNGATATVANILESTVSLSFNNMSNSRRFKILWDTHNVVGPNAGVTAAFAQGLEWIKVNIPCDIPIDYNSTATTGALTTQTSNNIGILGISVLGLVNVTYHVRIRFKG